MKGTWSSGIIELLGVASKQATLFTSFLWLHEITNHKDIKNLSTTSDNMMQDDRNKMRASKRKERLGFGTGIYVSKWGNHTV